MQADNNSNKCPPPKWSLKINRPLLHLKIVYFLFYSYWVMQYIYMTLIATEIVGYKQLAITYSGVPIFVVLGPTLSGYLGDKLGNYKTILIVVNFLGGWVYWPVLWLQAQHQKDPDLSYIFPALMVFQLLGFLLFDSSTSMLDSCGLSMSKKHGGDFGRQKMWSRAGMIVMPPFCGVLVDFMSEYQGFKDYSMVFYVATGMSLLVLPFIYQLDAKVEKNELTLLKTAKKVMGMVDVNVFLVVQIVVGVCWGWQRAFFVVFTSTELGASKTLFGAALAIGGVTTMIMYWTAEFIISKLGAPITMAVSLMLSCLRLTSYYFVSNPWFILVIELLDGVTGFLGVVSGNYFCSAAAPPGMLASLNGILTAAIFGIGRGLGLVIGCLLISSYGIRIGYLSLGILAGVTSIAYLIAYFLFLRKKEIKRLSDSPSTKRCNVEVPNADVRPVETKTEDP